MKSYYNAYVEALEILKHTPLEIEPSKFIKPKGSKNTLSESKRKQLRKKRKK